MLVIVLIFRSMLSKKYFYIIKYKQGHGQEKRNVISGED
jgi:hypothetical protein